MIGAAVYRLRALNTAWLPVVHGRFMHAAFFHALRDLSPELSGFLHDRTNSKPFTVSELRLPQQKITCEGNAWHIPRDMILHWRITGLDDIVLQAMTAIAAQSRIDVGHLRCEVERCMMNPEEAEDSGVLDENDLIAGCMNAGDIQQITFRFLSPVSFRYFSQDYPWPLPAYVFASLADKWDQNGMPGQIDRSFVREEAQAILPREWSGHSQKIFYTRQRGVLAFEGSFTYDLTPLPMERRHFYLMLAQYAVFAGVGRLTAQGMGQTRIEYE